MQVAVKGDALEVYLPITGNKNETALIMLIGVRPDDGGIAVDLRDVWLGSFHVPGWMSNLAIKPAISTGVFEMNRQLRQYAYIEKVEFSGDKVLLSGLLETKNFSLDSL